MTDRTIHTLYPGSSVPNPDRLHNSVDVDDPKAFNKNERGQGKARVTVGIVVGDK